jgi:hypothetical protein
MTIGRVCKDVGSRGSRRGDADMDHVSCPTDSDTPDGGRDDGFLTLDAASRSY